MSMKMIGFGIAGVIALTIGKVFLLDTATIAGI